MSNVLIDDESSRLKHFIWEELAENFYVAVIFRCVSGRRYVVQRHFEQQLLDLKSSFLQNKWRHCLYDVIHKSHAPIYITCHEVELMHEIFSWHLNYAKNHLKLRENVDYIVNFEDLFDSFQSLTLNEGYLSTTSIIQPVTTLDAARKNIELWKSLQGNVSQTESNEDVYKSLNGKQPVLTSSSTGWLQLDSKIMPFIKKQCDHLLLVDCLLKEHVISSSEDVFLRPLYIPIQSEDIDLFHTLIRRSSLTDRSLLITLDHLAFRLKRLFFIRFLPTENPKQSIDHQKIMSNHGGLVTLNNRSQQRLPFIYINQMKYIPQLNHLNFTSMSTFCMANPYELEYLRLISLYDYISSDENKETLESLSSTNYLTLIPIKPADEYQIQLSISLQDFHCHEYERRTQQEKNLKFYDNDGWWQPPLSSSTTRQKRTFSHFKLQRPIFF
ncbi:unnamed protein product [Adineta ricciae]|uniref:Uncharacterized protein n=1 Tax=Adineta ricciae TaxID=249248 RepID=A0A813SDM1_ADIRI|nr:unnamed protein product [Adineta ricciae]CAF1271347.1 unnamed protein product [Adineta ricciae]